MIDIWKYSLENHFENVTLQHESHKIKKSAKFLLWNLLYRCHNFINRICHRDYKEHPKASLRYHGVHWNQLQGRTFPVNVLFEPHRPWIDGALTNVLQSVLVSHLHHRISYHNLNQVSDYGWLLIRSVLVQESLVWIFIKNWWIRQKRIVENHSRILELLG